MAGYPHDDIETRWQAYWAEHQTFRQPGPGDAGFDAAKPGFYALDMFPYPSGAGLHVGHPEGYTATDIVARAKRMQGYNVLHPMGWDAFGLPAEQYAIATGTHPRETTRKNIATFRRQLQRLGFSYDWSREVDTTDPAYVRWTQWIFLKLYERGLAYESFAPVNWCPELGAVLANEEVVDGRSEIGGHPVVQMPMRQWMLRITDYADRLLDGLDDLDWPESVKAMQRNWIGRSEGAEVDFHILGQPEPIRVFTTRPDTLFGATYMVLAPEHPLVGAITTADQRAEVDAYVDAANRKTERERQENRTKTGVWTGAHAVNPANGDKVPVWISDYVLAGYGTGAIMAVPAHDARDFEFALAFGLPVRPVVQPPTAWLDARADGTDYADGTELWAATRTDAREWGEAYTGDGPIVNSDASGRPVSDIADGGVKLDDLGVEAAASAMLTWLDDNGVGRARTTYKLRDWLFSRQRYWGEPIPVVHVDGAPKPLPPDALPISLPEVESYQPAPTGESPLATQQDWLETTDPETGAPALRETNTMPQWAGSCWYYLRFIDPDNTEAPVDPEKEAYWMPVDLYVGGAEHAVLHLLYARFWHMVLFDAGVVQTPEPFRKLVNQGMILGEVEYTGFQRLGADGEPFGWVSAEHAVELDGEEAAGDATHQDARDGASLVAVRVEEGDVEKRGDAFVLRADGTVRVTSRAHKMSKSRGNVVNPDDIVAEYGADSLRLYEMFMGPLEQVKPWNTRSVDGVHRFLARAWRLLLDQAPGSESGAGSFGEVTGLAARVTGDAGREQLRALHAAIEKVTDDVAGLRFNTAISALMELLNAMYKWETVPRAVAEPFVLLLAPFAPHLAEELWAALGHDDTLAYAAWPELDEQYLVADVVEIAVQVNGKLRGTVELAPDATKEAMLEAARGESNVMRYLAEGTIRKEIAVPGRLVNFVVG